MRVFAVTRHQAVRDWLLQEGHEAEAIHHLDDETVNAMRSGDRVVGTLPAHLVAHICARGVLYYHLAMDLKEGDRGEELDIETMRARNARLVPIEARFLTGATW